MWQWRFDLGRWLKRRRCDVNKFYENWKCVNILWDDNIIIRLAWVTWKTREEQHMVREYICLKCYWFLSRSVLIRPFRITTIWNSIGMHTLVPFWPITNFSSDSTPFKTTEIVCSTVDSVKKKKKTTNKPKMKPYFRLLGNRGVCIQTCIFICINAFRCTKLWNKCSFTNAWTAKHINTIWINWSKWTWWIWYGWRLIWWHWTIGQTVATWTLSPKWITSIDNSCCLSHDDCTVWMSPNIKGKLNKKRKIVRKKWIRRKKNE